MFGPIDLSPMVGIIVVEIAAQIVITILNRL
jgi:hypothetical protein